MPDFSSPPIHTLIISIHRQTLIYVQMMVLRSIQPRVQDFRLYTSRCSYCQLSFHTRSHILVCICRIGTCMYVLLCLYIHYNASTDWNDPSSIFKGNTRVITQTALQTFQEEMGKALKDPYKVVMRQTKLPITLLQERAKVTTTHSHDCGRTCVGFPHPPHSPLLTPPPLQTQRNSVAHHSRK